jgi:hypothetical protein
VSWNIPKRIDPLILLSAAVALFLAASSEPWWSITGASNNLLRIEISPFYFHATATGLSPTVPFADFLGPLSRLLLAVAFVALGMVSLSPSAWWRQLAVYFSLSAFAELYLSFTLSYHAAETSLLGAYGVIPPYSGTAHLSAMIVGLDLNSYYQPLVTAGFSPSFYLGFVAIGLVGASLFATRLRGREKRSHRGVAAVFTSDQDTR